MGKTQGFGGYDGVNRFGLIGGQAINENMEEEDGEVVSENEKEEKNMEEDED